jgi:hypothetical protein
VGRRRIKEKVSKGVASIVDPALHSLLLLALEDLGLLGTGTSTGTRIFHVVRGRIKREKQQGPKARLVRN